MNDDLNEFERRARARLHSELGRVAVPAGRTSRARPRSGQRWGARIAGGSAVLAMLIMAAMIVAGGLPVPPQIGQAATPTAQSPQTAGGSPAERLILLSATRSTTIIRAVDPATRQVFWEREAQDQAAAASQASVSPVPAWIDGALSPDGRCVFVATRDGLAAYDAATGQPIWTKDPASAQQSVMHAPGRPSALAVAADGQRLYIQKETGQGDQRRRWLDVLDADTGAARAGIELPRYAGVAQVFALADQIYYVTASQVFMAEPGGQSFDLTRTVDLRMGVSVAAPARDGRSIYVSNGEILLNIDRSGLTTPLPAQYRPVEGLPTFPPGSLSEVISGTEMIIDYDMMEIDPEDPFWWTNGIMALSPDGKTAALWALADRLEPPRLNLYDVDGWKPSASIADPGTSGADWLRGDTLHFNASGTAIYAIAGPLGHGGGDSALLRLNIAGGSPTRLIELPGETVAALLLAVPAAEPAVAGAPAEAPPADPGQPLPPDVVRSGPALELSPADLEQMRSIPATARPLVPSGEIGWLLQDGGLAAWDRDGSTTRPITDSAIAAFRWSVPRPGKRPLLLVGLNDGRDAALDPETMAITPLDLAGAALEPPFFLSPDGAQLVFKRSSPGQTAALAQADLATGAIWTLIDGAALGDNWTWLADGTLAGWGADGIYLDVEAPDGHNLLRIQPRLDAGAAPPQFETLLRMADSGWLSLSPATGLVAYRRIGDPALYLLDTRSGQEQPVTTIDNSFFALSPDGSQLAYVQTDGANTYSLHIYSPQNKRVSVAAVGLGRKYSLYFHVRWSADGRYLILLTGLAPTQIQVFDTRSMVYDPDQPFAIVARYALPGAVSDVAVQQVEVGGNTVINVVTVTGGYDSGELDVYNPVNGTRQTLDLGPGPADLADVP